MGNYIQSIVIVLLTMLSFSACDKTENIIMPSSIIGLKAWVEHEYEDTNEDGINDIAKLTFHATLSEHATVDFNDVSLSWDGPVVHTAKTLPTEYTLDLDLSADSAHTFFISCRNTHSKASYSGTLPVVVTSGKIIVEVSIEYEATI